MIHNDMPKGSLEVICGSMFSGKSEELIRRLKRLLIAGLKVQVFKPDIDKRFSYTHIVSHNGTKIKAVPIKSPKHIIALMSNDTQAVAVDEVQFFSDDIADVCCKIADSGRKVIVAGLDMDFRGRPFGAMPMLMAQAECVTKLKAVCSVCGDDASKTLLMVNGKPAVNIGDKDNHILIGAADKGYAPVCRSCYVTAFRNADSNRI